MAARSRSRPHPRRREARARRWLVIALALVAVTGTVGAVVATRTGGGDGSSTSASVRSLVTLSGVDPAAMASLGFVLYVPTTTDGALPLATAEDDLRTAIGGQVAVTDAQLVDLASPDASADDPGRLCWAFVVRRCSLDARPDSAGAQPTTEIVVIDARSGAVVYQGA